MAGTANATGDAQYVGVVGCQNSLCHGGASPTRGEFVSWVWSQQDYHSRSYMTLVQSRSAEMAQALKIKNPAADERCTACHAPLSLVTPERLAATAHAEEGVTCESCHGPAGSWLRSHTRTDYSYQQRVESGMADLKSIYVRAGSCVACHQNIDSALIAAGHPILFFELNRQSIQEPAHWNDADAWSSPRAWLVGQCVALREISWKLSREKTDPEAQAQWESLFWLLDLLKEPLELNWDSTASSQTPGDYGQWIARADTLAHQADRKSWSNQQLKACLEKLAETKADFGISAADFSARDYYRLKRLALAVDSLQKPFNNGQLEAVSSNLNILSSTPSNFVPDEVSLTLDQLTAAVQKIAP